MFDLSRRPERRAAVAFLLGGLTILLAAIGPATAQVDQPKRATVTVKKGIPMPRQDDSKFAVSGRVLRPDGLPAAGATVDWVGHFSTRDSHDHFGGPYPGWTELPDTFRTIGHAVADRDGRYAIAADLDWTWLQAPGPVAWAPGFALAGRTLGYGFRNWDVTLAPAVKIKGRLLTPDGGPAAGIKVDLATFTNIPEESAKDETLSMDLAIPEADRPAYWPKTRITDADGRFVLDGTVPKGMIATLLIHHPDYAEAEVRVATGPTSAKSGFRNDTPPLPTTFTLRLEPARTIEGVVTAKDTGEPIAGIEVQIPGQTAYGHHLRTVLTDAQGRYRIVGHHGETLWAHSFPPAGSPFLEGFAMESRAWPQGVATQALNFALDRGRVFRGTILDAATRGPIAGARIIYRPEGLAPDDPTRNGLSVHPVTSNAHGRFAVTGIEGAGVLLVEAPTEAYIRTRVESKTWGADSFAYPHAWARVRGSAGSEAAPVEFLVRKGVTLQARALDPTGQPLPRISAWCPEREYRQFKNARWLRPFDDGIFELPGAEPGRTYRVFMRGDDGEFRNYCGGVVEIKCGPAAIAPVAISLAPTATIRGRAVGKNGKPIGTEAIRLAIAVADDGQPLRREDVGDRDQLDLRLQESWNDAYRLALGEFRFERLIPGVRYALTMEQGGELFREVRAPRPGEVIDLGQVVVDDNP